MFKWLSKWFEGNRWDRPTAAFPASWNLLLIQNIPYYQNLSKTDRAHFRYKVQEFLHNVDVNGYDTEIDDLDRIYVASSAVIPIFAFKDWQYKYITEVLIYPDSFTRDFRTEGGGRNILGMVGSGVMENRMILSQQALRLGFKNESDKKNTAIHEFIHLIDKADGVIDGIPAVLLERQYVIPWIDMIERKMEEMLGKRSDINPYATTSRIEFFAVLGEYFFERPRLLKKKHPVLYEILLEIFNHDPSMTIKK